MTDTTRPASSPAVDVMKYVTPEIEPLLRAAAFGLEEDTEYDAHALADWLEESGADEDAAAIRARPERSIYWAREKLLGPIDGGSVNRSGDYEIVAQYGSNHPDMDGNQYVLTNCVVDSGELELEDGDTVEVYRWADRDDNTGDLFERGGWVYDPEEAAQAARDRAEELHEDEEDEEDDMEFIDGEEG